MLDSGPVPTEADLHSAEASAPWWWVAGIPKWIVAQLGGPWPVILLLFLGGTVYAVVYLQHSWMSTESATHTQLIERMRVTEAKLSDLDKTLTTEGVRTRDALFNLGDRVTDAIRLSHVPRLEDDTINRRRRDLREQTH